MGQREHFLQNCFYYANQDAVDVVGGVQCVNSTARQNEAKQAAWCPSGIIWETVKLFGGIDNKKRDLLSSATYGEKKSYEIIHKPSRTVVQNSETERKSHSNRDSAYQGMADLKIPCRWRGYKLKLWEKNPLRFINFLIWGSWRLWECLGSITSSLPC